MEYCKPWNAGLQSETRAVGRRLGRLLDSLADEINPNIASGPIVEELVEVRFKIIRSLTADGWIITIPNNRYIVKRAKGGANATA